MRIPVVTYDGLKVLNNLANEHYSWFRSPDADRIRSEVERRCPEGGFEREIELGVGVAELNRFATHGPEKDAEHAPVVREALDLTLVEATDSRLWASVNCFALGDYVPIRWGNAAQKTKSEWASWVRRHWLDGAGRSGFRLWNTAARLWWLTEIASRASRHSSFDRDQVLQTLSTKVNLYHQIMYRPYLASNSRVTAIIHDLAVKGNEHLFSTRHINELLKPLNQRAGYTVLEALSKDELRSLVERCLPPKRTERGGQAPQTPPALRVLSLGGGAQSTAMALMADAGMFSNRPDVAIFADTGWEPSHVYKTVEQVRTRVSYPVEVVSNGRNLREDVFRGVNAQGQPWLSIPVYLADRRGGDVGINWRQCTNQYKIKPIRRKALDLLGVQPKGRVPPETRIEMWLGISTDEVTRMKPNADWFVDNRYPLIDEINYSREECVRWLKENHPDLPVGRSACVGCPFRSSSSWVGVRESDPDEFAKTLELDSLLRSESHWAGQVFRKDAYLHYRRVPLKEAIELDLEEMKDRKQATFDNECEGYCGV